MASLLAKCSGSYEETLSRINEQLIVPENERTKSIINPDDPLLLPLKPLKQAYSKAIALIRNTQANMECNGRGPRTISEQTRWYRHTILSIIFAGLHHAILCQECPNGLFRVRPVTKESRALVTQPGQYRLKSNESSKSQSKLSKDKTSNKVQSKCGSSNNKDTGMAGRMFRQRVDLQEFKKNRRNVGIMLAELTGSAGVYSTLPESRKKAAQYPLLEEIAKTLALEAPAFKCNEDKIDGIIGEAVNFLFEFSYMSSMPASFGYALEKVFNCGDIGIRWMCRILVAPSIASRNAGAVSELNGTTDIRPLFTWETEISGVREDIDLMSDEASLQALGSMLRPGHADGHLQNYETKTLFDNHADLKQKVDTFRSEGYAAVKRAVAEIRAAMNSTADLKVKIRVVKAAIATIDKNSKFGERYLPPTDKKEYAIQCGKKLRDVKDAVVTSNEVKPLIVVEYETKKQLKPDDAEEHFPSNSIIHKMHNYDGTLAGEVYVYDYKKKTIRILLVPSGHIIRGSRAGVKARMTVGKSMVTIMSYLAEARVVPTSAFERYCDIFYAQAIEMIGLGSKDEVVDEELVMASVHNARYAALPDGLGRGNPICSGVYGLSQLISPVNGIDEQKVVCLMTVLGFDDFMSMMKDIYAIELPCDFSTWLLTLGDFNDPSVRINVAKRLYDNEANRDCAKKTGLPDGWLALKSKSQGRYAIRAPNGNCYSSINSLPPSISKAAISFVHKQGWNQPKSAELIAAQEKEFNRSLRITSKFISTKAKAEKGDADSMIELAKMYLFGNGTTKDEEKAYHWFDKASNYSEIAIAWVADCYLLGLGVEKDYDEGYDYLFDSASGDEGESNMFCLYSYAKYTI